MMTQKEKVSRLTRIAKTLSDKEDINLVDSSIAATDGKIITVPINETWEGSCGLTAHESFHIRAHSFAPCLERIGQVIAKKYKIDIRTGHNIANITEDFRINEWVKKTYLGFFKMLKDVEMEAVKKNQLSARELPLVFQLAIALVDFEKEFINEIRQSRVMELTTEDYERIDELGDNILQNLSPEYGVIAANELAKIYVNIRDRLMNEKKQQKRQKGQKGQDSEQEGQKGQRGKESQEGEQEQQEGQKEDKASSDESNELTGKSNENSISKELEKILQKEQEIEQEYQENEEETNEKKARKQYIEEKEIKEFENREQTKINETELDKPSGEQDGIEIQNMDDEEKDLTSKINRIIRELQNDKKIDEEMLEEAMERCVEEIEKISKREMDDKDDSEKLVNEYGQKCERIKDMERLEKGARETFPPVEQIIRDNRGLINQITRILGLKTEKVLSSRGHKIGRLNRDVVRAVASDYSYRSCFSRIDTKEKGKMMIILDLSGSMRGSSIKMLKEAVVTIAKALENSADLRIVGYTTGYTFVFKEFGEATNMKKLNLIGLRNEGGSTPTGISVKTEFTFMKRNLKDALTKIPIVLITDGEPDNKIAAEKAIKEVRKHASMYGIGIRCSGSGWSQLFGPNNFVVIRDDRELKMKLIEISRKIVRNF